MTKTLALGCRAVSGEEHVPTDTALAALAEDTIWYGCAAYAADPAVEVGDRWYLTGSRYPGLNGVFPGEDPLDVAGALVPFQRRQVPMLWHLGPRAPRRLAARLRAAGCVFHEEEPLMVADLSAPPPASPVPGLTVVPADTEARLADFARVWSGRPDPPELDALIRLRRAAGGTFSHLLGLRDGVPVACAAAYHGPDAGEVQHVVTMRGERCQGIGTWLTRQVLLLIRERGVGTAVLTASPYGHRIYRRLGFRTVGRIRRYRWQPAC
jgi:ribosomal protein S18 acetylase RimI-like enzyme